MPPPTSSSAWKQPAWWQKSRQQCLLVHTTAWTWYDGTVVAVRSSLPVGPCPTQCPDPARLEVPVRPGTPSGLGQISKTAACYMDEIMRELQRLLRNSSHPNPHRISTMRPPSRVAPRTSAPQGLCARRWQLTQGHVAGAKAQWRTGAIASRRQRVRHLPRPAARLGNLRIAA